MRVDGKHLFYTEDNNNIRLKCFWCGNIIAYDKRLDQTKKWCEK